MAQQDLDISSVLEVLQRELKQTDSQDKIQDNAIESLPVAEMERLVDNLELELCKKTSLNGESPFALSSDSSCNYNVDNVILSLYDEQGRNPNYLGPHLDATTSKVFPDEKNRHTNMRMAEHNNYYYDAQATSRVDSEEFLLQLVQSKQHELAHLEAQLANYRGQLPEDLNLLELVNKLYNSQDKLVAQGANQDPPVNSIEQIQQQTLASLAKLTASSESPSQVNNDVTLSDDQQLEQELTATPVANNLESTTELESTPEKLVVTINSQGQVNLSAATPATGRKTSFPYTKKHNQSKKHNQDKKHNLPTHARSGSKQLAHSATSGSLMQSKINEAVTQVGHLAPNLLATINNVANGDIVRKLELITLASQILDGSYAGVNQEQGDKTRDLLLSLIGNLDVGSQGNSADNRTRSSVTQVPQYTSYPKFQTRSPEVDPVRHRHLSLLHLAKLHADHEQAVNLLMQAGYLGNDTQAQNILTQRLLANISSLATTDPVPSDITALTTKESGKALALAPQLPVAKSLQLLNSSSLATLPRANPSNKQQTYPLDFNGSEVNGTLSAEVTTSETSTTEDKVITKPSKGVKIVSRTSSTTQTRTVRQIIKDDGAVISQVIDTNVSYEAVTDTLDSGELQTSSSRTVAKKISSNQQDIVQALEQSQRSYNLTNSLPHGYQQIVEEPVMLASNYLEHNASKHEKDSGQVVKLLPTTVGHHPALAGNTQELLQSFIQRQKELADQLRLQTSLLKTQGMQVETAQLLAIQQQSEQLAQALNTYLGNEQSINSAMTDIEVATASQLNQDLPQSLDPRSTQVDTIEVNLPVDDAATNDVGATIDHPTESQVVDGVTNQSAHAYAPESGANYQDLQISANSSLATKSCAIANSSLVINSTLNNQLMTEQDLIHITHKSANASQTASDNAITITMDEIVSAEQVSDDVDSLTTQTTEIVMQDNSSAQQNNEHNYPVKALANIFSDELEDESFIDSLFAKFDSLSIASEQDDSDSSEVLVTDDNHRDMQVVDVTADAEISTEDCPYYIDYESLTAPLRKLACQFSITPEEFDAKLRHYLFSDDDVDCDGDEICEKVTEIRNEVRANLRDNNPDGAIEQLTDAFEVVLASGDCHCDKAKE